MPASGPTLARSVRIRDTGCTIFMYCRRRRPRSSMHAYPTASVPKGLRWSVATAAFQIEGSRAADGRGRSIWDDVVDTPGVIKDGSTADPSADSYRRVTDDVALLRGLGVDRYRFGISWVRVQPDGTGS